MTELIIAGIIVIIVLFMIVWFVSRALFEAEDRLESAQTALRMQRKSQAAVNAKIQQQNKDYAKNQTTISDRQHFGH